MAGWRNQVDAHDSKSCAGRREGSIPSPATKKKGFSRVTYTYEFIEVDFPCKTCITQAMCQYVKYLEAMVKRSKILAVPDFDENKATYHRVLIECWVNLGNQILRNTTKIVASNNKTAKNHGVPFDHLILISKMAALMEYIIHSASWRDGQVYQFDKVKINRDLKFMRS